VTGFFAAARVAGVFFATLFFAGAFVADERAPGRAEAPRDRVVPLPDVRCAMRTS